MATQVQLRRGTTVQHSTFTGAVAEVTYDTDKKTLIVHDGSTAGGFELAVVGNDVTVDDLIVSGNLTVNGTTTTVNSATLSVADNIITLNSDVTGTPSQDAGIEVERGTSTNAVIQWDETNDYWEIASGGTTGRILTTGDSSSFATSAQGSTADSAMQDLVDDTTPQLGGDLASNGNDILFGDNDKAIFGAGSDLQIYHDGSNSVIADTGAGDLYIQASSLVRLTNVGASEHYAKFNENGAVQLYYDNSLKLATTSTGIDVTGTVTADGLTVDGIGYINASLGDADGIALRVGNVSGTTGGTTRETAIAFYDADNPTLTSAISGERDNPAGNYFGNMVFRTNGGSTTSSLSGLTQRMRINSNGNISFYEDTGATAKFFWDASEQSATITAIDNLAATYPLQIQNSAGSLTTGYGSYGISMPAGSNYTMDINGDLIIDTGGNVGIGTDSPASLLHIESDSSDPTLRITNKTAAVIDTGPDIEFWNNPFTDSTTNSYESGAIRVRKTNGTANNHDHYMSFWTRQNSPEGINERMRIDSSGNVLVGKTSNSISGAGVVIRGTGEIFSTRAGDVAGFNRLTTDGLIVQFYKDSSVVGGIGNDSTNMFIVMSNANNVGIAAGTSGGTPVIFPTSNAGTVRNNAVTLGYSTGRFKDGYFGGTLYAARGVGATNTDTTNSGSVTLDFATYQNHVLTLTGNVTLANPTTEVIGQSGFIIFKQDGTGGRTVSLGSEFLTAGGAGLTLSSAANAIDMVPYVVIASGQILLGTPQLAFA